MDGCRWLIRDISEGDQLFFYFLGNSRNGGICPSDYDTTDELLTFEELHDTIAKPLPTGVNLLCFFVHFFSLLDLEKSLSLIFLFLEFFFFFYIWKN